MPYPDAAREAAERLLEESRNTVPAVVWINLVVPRLDIETVAHFALEAVDREARLTEALNLAGSGLAATYAHFMGEGAERDAADVLEMINKVDAALAPASGEE